MMKLKQKNHNLINKLEINYKKKNLFNIKMLD